MQERSYCEPDIYKKQTRKKEQVVEKGSMKLFLTKSLRAHKEVFSVQIRNEAANACQQSKVRITSEDGCNHAGEKDVGAEIQSTDLAKMAKNRIKSFANGGNLQSLEKNTVVFFAKLFWTLLLRGQIFRRAKQANLLFLRQ